jgi:hypothetical protein
LRHRFGNRNRVGWRLAGGTEFLDDRLYNEKALKELLPVTVISEIPAITSPQEERKQGEEALGGLGNGRGCFCNRSWRIGDKLFRG